MQIDSHAIRPDASAAVAQLHACSELSAGEVPPVGRQDPILACSIPITAAATAVHQVLAIALRRLGGVNGPTPQTVDPAHATAWLRSYRYFGVEGSVPASPFDSLTGFYATQDGRYVYCHCNFPHHARGLARLLGVAQQRAAIAEAIANWRSQDLEQALADQGLCGGVVRTSLEWRDHPQSRALSATPLFELRCVGDAPIAAHQGEGLTGQRILDLTRVLAGPTSTRLLAEQGAEVLRITAQHLPDSGYLDWDTGLGKRNAFLDLRQADDRTALWRLIEKSDVICQAYRPGALSALGFDPVRLGAVRPGVVCANLSAYGAVGPWGDRRGYDTVVQSVSGLALEDSDDGVPRLMPVQALDYLAGGVLAIAICTALWRRRQEGGSWVVSTSLARVARWLADFGHIARQDWVQAPAEFTAEQLASWTVELEGPLGRTRHLRSPLPDFGTLVAPRPLGADSPQWAKRE